MKLLPSADQPASPPDQGTRPTVVLAESDPYLAFLLRLHVPEATVVEADPRAPAVAVQAMEPDLVIIGLEAGSDTVRDLLAARPRAKVIGVVDGARAGRTTVSSALDGILARPFVPSELVNAVRASLGLRAPDDRETAVTPVLARARSWVAPARVAAVAVAAVVEVGAGEVSRARAYILALAFVYTTLRWALRRQSVAADTADVAVACALIAATGGLRTNYLLFALVVAAAVGLKHGPRWGATAGLAIVAGSTHVVAADLAEEAASAREVAAWYLLFPLLGIAAGFAGRLWRVTSPGGMDVLVEANRVLSSLYRIARTLPGGLEIGTVAESAMQEVRDTMRSHAGGMLLAEAGTYVVVGSFGLRDPSAVTVRDMRTGLGAALHDKAAVLPLEEMHPVTAMALGDHPCWLAAPMVREGVPLGLLIAACPDHPTHGPNTLLLRQLAAEVAVAVENARLFSRVREISIDEERKRLARELHDGVAQALTHLRFELDFMSRHGTATPDVVRQEIQRLSRVVGRASGEIRSMILGLRSSVSAEGLVGSLRSYLNDLRGLGGPEITFDARGETRLRPDVESEIFRIAQEAVSNALRHADATKVQASLVATTTQVRLMVEDDGVGIRRRGAKSEGATGVGLQAMNERAESIGAQLDVAERAAGGTRVTLVYTIEEDG